MSLGDLVISISADTARFQNDLGKAGQSVERWANITVRSAQQGEKYIAKMAEAGMTSIDRLQREFNSLGTTTAKSIESAAFATIASFVKIRESGVTSFGEIERAEAAARAKISQLPGVLDASGASVGRLSTKFGEMGQTAIAKMEEMKDQAQRDFVAMQLAGEASVNVLNAAFSKFTGAEQAVKNLRSELELVNAEMQKMVKEQSLSNSFKGLGIRSTDDINKERQSVIDNFNNVKSSGAAPADIERAYTAMQDTLQRLEKESLTVAEQAARDRIAATQKEVSEREAMYARLFDEAYMQERKGVIAEEKAAADKIAATAKEVADRDAIYAGLFDQAFLKERQAVIAAEKAAAEKAAAAQKEVVDRTSMYERMFVEIEQQERKSNADRIASQIKMYDEAVLMDKRLAHDKIQAQIKMYDEAVMLDQKRTRDMAVEAAKRAALVAKEAAEANVYATKNQGLAGDRLQGSFDVLGLKSSLNIEVERAKVIAAFEKIKASGVASANEIKQAHAAMKRKLDEIEGTTSPANKHTNSINLLSLASIAAIAKVQILYSLINQTMSLIGSLPSTAVDAIETFQSSMIKNAAVITSMGGGVADIGKAYQENKKYAEAVQNVLVKMDAHTIASYKQLQLMNDAFVNQGVFIDINNKKQLEGYQNTANALATISAGMSNPDMQFSQEIRGLLNGEDKPTNMLFRQLKAIDPLLKDHLADWKKIAAETGNAGYVLEKLGPLLVGYAAASGDIDSLWTTVKSTMSTIRDEVLRGGLKEGFEEIVIQMKEIAKQANDNKEKIQAMLKEGFGWAKVAAEYLWNVGKAASYLAEPAIWLGISAGIIKVATSMTTLTSEITLATAGLNILVAGLIAAAAYTGKEYFKAGEMESRLKDIKASAVDGSKGSLSAGLQRERVDRLTTYDLEKILRANPLASNAEIAEWIKAGAVKKTAGNNADAASIVNSMGLSINQNAINAMKADAVAANAIKIPKAPKGAGGDEAASVSDYNKFAGMFNNLVDSAELDNYDSKLAKIETQIMNLKTAYDSMSESERKSFAAFQKKQGFDGDPIEWLRNQKIAKLDASEEQSAKDYAAKFEKNTAKQSSMQDMMNLSKQLEFIKASGEAEINAYNKLDARKKLLLEQNGVDLEVIKQRYKELGEEASMIFHDKIEKSLAGQEVGILKVAKSYTKAVTEAIIAENAMQNDWTLEERARKFLIDNARIGEATYKEIRGFEELKIQILELSEQYEKVAIARRDLEKLSPEYNALSDEERAERDKLSAFDVLQGQVRDKQRIFDNAGKMQSAFGGANYGSQIAGIDSEYDAESQKLRDMYSTQLIDKQKFNEEMLQMDRLYAAQKEALGLSISEDALNIAKQGFADSKAMQVVILAMETSIAISRIMMNSAVAKSAAIAAAQMAGPLSPAMEAAAISRISAYEAMSIGLVMAGSAIQGMNIAGGRANGGPVIAGQTYIVNENRASEGPEYFTPGVNGVITPASKLGGSTYAPVYNIDARNSTLNEQQITSIVKRANETTKAEILNSMNRGGEFALASGRVR